MDTSVLIKAANNGSYDWSKGILMNTLRLLSSSRVRIEETESDFYAGSIKRAKNSLKLGLAYAKGFADFGSCGRTDNVYVTVASSLVHLCRTNAMLPKCFGRLSCLQLHLHEFTPARCPVQ
jgi:hypothetical protein